MGPKTTVSFTKTRPKGERDPFIFYRVLRCLNMKRITFFFLCLASLSFSAIGQNTPADDTGRNKVDRSGDTKTSGDQSNTAEDTKTTAAIRRAIVSDSSLTMTAKNVKIVTENGKVTLRGPVKNATEKKKIAELAAKAAGNAKIDNQLEVEQPR